MIVAMQVPHLPATDFSELFSRHKKEKTHPFFRRGLKRFAIPPVNLPHHIFIVTKPPRIVPAITCKTNELEDGSM